MREAFIFSQGLPGEAPAGPRSLLGLLLRIGAHRGRAVAGKLLEIVLQKADLDAAAREALGLRILIAGRKRGIAHSDEVDAIDRDVMVEHEVADNGLGHLLRSRDGSLALAGREALDFDDVAALTLDAAGHLVKSVLGILAEDGLAGAEADFGLVGGL